MLDSIKIFWKWFSENRQEFENYLPLQNVIPKEEYDHIFEDFEANLALCSEHVKYTMGRKQGGFELVITANGILENFEDVTEIANAAPEMENWDVIAFVQPMDVSSFVFRLADFELNQNNVYFSYAHQESPERGDYLEVILYTEDDNFQDSDIFKSSISRIMEAALGEYCFYKSTDLVAIKKKSDLEPSHTSGLLPLTNITEATKKLQK